MLHESGGERGEGFLMASKMGCDVKDTWTNWKEYTREECM